MNDTDPTSEKVKPLKRGFNRDFELEYAEDVIYLDRAGMTPEQLSTLDHLGARVNATVDERDALKTENEELQEEIGRLNSELAALKLDYEQVEAEKRFATNRQYISLQQLRELKQSAQRLEQRMAGLGDELVSRLEEDTTQEVHVHVGTIVGTDPKQLGKHITELLNKSLAKGGA